MLSEESPILPDQDAIRRDLEYMTARWGELRQSVVFEVRAFKEGAQPQTAKFAPDWIDDAVDWIVSLNELGFNIYAVRNPIDAKISGSASDKDIVASFFLWADCDDPQAAGNVYRFDGPKWTSAVTTGTVPSIRVHTYWMLNEPCTDMAEWRSCQEAIAAHFGSDSTVVNPSRIMRVGGTVSYPAKRKQERGYQKELSVFRNEYDDARLPVTLDQMRRVFASSAKPAATPDRIHIETGIEHGRSVDDFSKLLQSARTDGEKHGAVRNLAASLAGQGVKRALAEAIIREACPVWDRNVEDLIESAYRKFHDNKTELTPEQKAEIPAALFKPWVKKDLAAIPYPEFLYSDFYARGYTSLTLAAPKVGKSMLGLAEALDMATGRGFLTGVKRDPLRVVYYNAEDDQDVLDARVSALLSKYNIEQEELEGNFWPTSGVEMDDFFLIAGQEGLINEPLFVSIEKFCIEQKADVLIFDPLQDLSASPETNEVFRLLGQRLRKMASGCKISLGLIHHTRKIAPGMKATIEDGRGGSALRGTARFNRILNPMTEDEAAKAGVENHRFYFRFGDMESNLAPPSADVNRWFEKVSVPTPNGQHIGAIAPWSWPDAFNGITRQQAARVRAAIDQMEEPPRQNVRSTKWVGEVVADVLELDLSQKMDKERVKTLIAGWVKEDVLRVVEAHDARAGRSVEVVIAGSNNPLLSGGEA